MPRVLKPVDFSGLSDVRMRHWLRVLARSAQQVSGALVTTPPGPISGGTTVINNFGLQFVNDLVYGALLNQGLGWARNRISFNPNTSTDPLVIDTNATKRAFPFVVLTQNYGYVMADAQAPPHYWQFRTSTDGIPFCEDKGFITNNPTLSLV